MVAPSLAVVALFAAGCGGGDRDPGGRIITIEIPSGAGKRLASGGDAPMPKRITGRVGDQVRIVNHDARPYVISGITIPAGLVATIPLRRSGVYETECTAHRDDSITMVVAER
ncbi:MAG: hypothetical protein U0R52_09995 [Solirubrobacterales bacterium]